MKNYTFGDLGRANEKTPGDRAGQVMEVVLVTCLSIVMIMLTIWLGLKLFG